MSFSSEIARWSGNVTEEMAALHKAIILELFTSVILDTPVLTGRLRGNWQITSKDPAKGVIEVTDPSGQVVTRQVEDLVTKLDAKRDFSVFLTNNLPYAYRIEYDGWSSVKAPQGMVRKNYIRISENLKAA